MPYERKWTRRKFIRSSAATAAALPLAAKSLRLHAAGPSSCVFNPEQEEGPYYVDRELLRNCFFRRMSAGLWRKDRCPVFPGRPPGRRLHRRSFRTGMLRRRIRMRRPGRTGVQWDCTLRSFALLRTAQDDNTLGDGRTWLGCEVLSTLWANGGFRYG